MKKIMHIGFFCIVYLMVSGAYSIAKAESEFKDTPYFTKMPNYQITDGEDKEFEAFQFCIGKKYETVEGRYSKRYYEIKEDAKPASLIQISRNYVTAIKNMGGTILFDGVPWETSCEENIPCGTGRLVTAQIKKGDKELWVLVSPCNEGNDYTLILVEKEAMKQDVTASSILDALNREGHIALYINFDTGKSTIKGESKQIISQIVEMMNANPDLKIGVEGHTDNVGNSKSNKTLSDDRAKSVVAAIVAEGIDAKRLSAAGFGPDKPIADNKTEEGRAKNRRVELVKK